MKNKRVIYAILAFILIALSIFYLNRKEYNKMPEKAKNQVAIYVSEKYSFYYVNKSELNCCISKTKGGYTLKIAGSVRRNYNNKHVTIVAKVKFNNFYKKPKVVSLKIK